MFYNAYLIVNLVTCQMIHYHTTAWLHELFVDENSDSYDRCLKLPACVCSELFRISCQNWLFETSLFVTRNRHISGWINWPPYLQTVFSTALVSTDCVSNFAECCVWSCQPLPKPMLIVELITKQITGAYRRYKTPMKLAFLGFHFKYMV